MAKRNTPWPRWLKVSLLSLAIALAVGGGIYGILILIRGNGDAVNVYPATEISMYASSGNAETGGNVTADRVQSVYVSDTQQVTRIFVTKGQEVHAGDRLLSFDTTLTDLELERQGIEVRRLELELDNAKKDQARINTYRVSNGTGGASSPEGEASEEPSALKLVRQGSGTQDDPAVIIWNESCELDEEFLGLLFNQYGDTVYMVFEQRSGDALKGGLLRAWEMVFRRQNEKWSFTVVEPKYTEQSGESQDVPIDFGTSYTYAELVAMKQNAAQRIRKLELDLQVAKLKYDTLSYELGNGVVVSKIDGVVKSVLDPNEALMSNQPVVLISGGGGFYVTGAMSETELAGMHVGDKVSVMSWENYSSVEGTIRSISEYPAEDNYSYHYSKGNQNVTLFPFTVFIEEDALLREGEYVQISYAPSSEADGLYLMKPFIRTENGVSYILCEDAEGKLERRNVQTGASLWGSYLRVIGDFDRENDHIAFPYGNHVRVGAKTRRAAMNELYGY